MHFGSEPCLNLFAANPLMVMTSPSTAHTVQLDLAIDAKAMFRMEPPAYLLHQWSKNCFITHHVNAVQSPGPYPFFNHEGQLIMS